MLGYFFIPLLYMIGMLSTPFLLAYLSVTITFGIFISISALILEEVELCRSTSALDLCVLAFVAIIENFGYRQFNNVWRIMGWWQFLRKNNKWGDMRRKGFAPAANLSA